MRHWMGIHAFYSRLNDSELRIQVIDSNREIYLSQLFKWKADYTPIFAVERYAL